MSKYKFKRLFNYSLLLLSIIIGIGVILYNLEQNIVFFHPPSKIHQINLPKKVRIGGIVKNGSIRHITTSEIQFIITVNHSEMKVTYKGILPMLFREGQGIVAEGILTNYECFNATQLLTKHDENYRPPS